VCSELFRVGRVSRVREGRVCEELGEGSLQRVSHLNKGLRISRIDRDGSNIKKMLQEY
jgi:hypothetical protein